MKILHVIHQYAPESSGGSESYVGDLVRHQRAHGHDCAVVTGSIQPWEKVGVERIEVGDVPVHRIHRNDLYFDHHVKAWNPQVERVFAELLRELRPDVVHVHHWVRLTSTLVALCAAAGIPAVVTLHDFYVSCPRAFRIRPGVGPCRLPVGGKSCATCVPRYGHESGQELREGVDIFADGYRDELALAAAVLVGVQSTVELLAETTGIDKDRFSVLPMGYRRRYQGAARLEPHPGLGGAMRFAFWGGVGRHKGVDVLIDAYRLLAREDAELHVLGGFESPAFARELREHAKGLSVHFHGPFTAADLRKVGPQVGVFPSTCIETFGIVLDECNELGLPCIVSDQGALPERVGSGGLVVPVGDAAALAAAMGRIMDDAELRERMVAQLPALPPSMSAHAKALELIYEAARKSGPHEGPRRVSLDRRIDFLAMQRETAMGRQGHPRDPD